MHVARYLRRIRCSGPTDVSAETLRGLHRAHLHAVPFENLDIGLGRPIVLDEGALFRKIVEEERGGFCYELNGLFAGLLRRLGFEVEMLAAGVASDDGDFGPPFDHMVLHVRLGESWLADVGFGDSFLEPLPLEDGRVTAEGRHAYRVLRRDPYRVLERREDDGPWQPQFRFTPEPHVLADYEPMCRHHQTSPDSHFTRRRVCTLAVAGGRVTLSDRRLIVTGPDGRREERALEESEVPGVLASRFGIRL